MGATATATLKSVIRVRRPGRVARGLFLRVRVLLIVAVLSCLVAFFSLSPCARYRHCSVSFFYCRYCTSAVLFFIYLLHNNAEVSYYFNLANPVQDWYCCAGSSSVVKGAMEGREGNLCLPSHVFR